MTKLKLSYPWVTWFRCSCASKCQKLKTLKLENESKWASYLYCWQNCVMSTTRSLITYMCGKGVMVVTCLGSILTEHKHATVLIPSIFMEHEPHIPSRQLRLYTSVGSISFFYFTKHIQHLLYLHRSFCS